MVDRLEAKIKDDPDLVHWSSYIGQGAIRFYLPLDQQLQNPYYAQLVIVSKGLEERAGLFDQTILSGDLGGNDGDVYPPGPGDGTPGRAHR